MIRGPGDGRDETVKMLAAKMPPMAKVLKAVGRLPGAAAKI
jgi:hypothetical protein